MNSGRRRDKYSDGLSPRGTFGTNILSISHLSGQLICEYLPISSLLTLRLVCKQTKSWVESQRILKKIPIELQNSKQIQRVMQSSIPWNNFLIKCSNLDIQTYLPKFIQATGHRIKVLKITAICGYRKKIDFLLACPNLEVVDIGDIEFRQATPAEVDVLLLNFEHLKELSLGEICDVTNTTWITEMVMRLVTKSPTLVTLKLPIFHHDSCLFEEQEDNEFQKRELSEIWRVRVIQPMIKYLESRSIQKGLQKSNLKFLDINGLAGIHPDFSATSFRDLVEACGRSNTQLMNVSQFLFPKFDVNFDLSETGLGIIHSVDGFQENIDYSRMVNLKKLKVHLTPSESYYAGGYGNDQFYNYGFPMPSLECLDVTFMFDIDKDPNPAMIEGLFQTYRPSVTTLKITWNLERPRMVIDAKELVRRFPNVKKLELDGCPGKDEEFLVIFEGMRFLEDLKIKDCRYITDSAFLGLSPNHPAPFLDLKHLKRLWIRAFQPYDAETGITDHSFRWAFANMPIRHFTYTTIGPTNISLNGIAGLDNLPFRNTIEYLNMAKPLKVQDWSIHRITRAFKNLKRGF